MNYTIDFNCFCEYASNNDLITVITLANRLADCGIGYGKTKDEMINNILKIDKKILNELIMLVDPDSCSDYHEAELNHTYTAVGRGFKYRLLMILDRAMMSEEFGETKDGRLYKLLLDTFRSYSKAVKLEYDKFEKEAIANFFGNKYEQFDEIIDF